MCGTDLRRSPQWLPIRSSTSLENACSLHWAENSAQSPACQCHHWQQSLMCCPNHPFKTISEGVKRTNLFNFLKYLPMVSVCNSTKYVPYREGLRFTFQLAYLVSFAFCTLMHTCILAYLSAPYLLIQEGVTDANLNGLFRYLQKYKDFGSARLLRNTWFILIYATSFCPPSYCSNTADMAQP